MKILPGRVAQIVGTWERRSEEVEEEKENGRKWIERECPTPVKYDSVLLRNGIFCHKMLKYGTFCRETLKYGIFCRKTLKYGTFCRKTLKYALRENNSK